MENILIRIVVNIFRSRLNDLLTREPPTTCEDLRHLLQELAAFQEEFQDAIHFVEDLSDLV